MGDIAVNDGSTTTIGEKVLAVAKWLEVDVRPAEESRSTVEHHIAEAAQLTRTTPYRAVPGDRALMTYLDDNRDDVYVLAEVADRETLRMVATSAMARAAVLLEEAHRAAAEARLALDTMRGADA